MHAAKVRKYIGPIVYYKSKTRYVVLESQIVTIKNTLKIGNFFWMGQSWAKFYRPQSSTVTTWFSNAYDNYHYYARELFLYTIALCLIHEKYSIAADLFYSRYSFKGDYYREEKDYSALGAFVQVFDEYIKQRDNTNYYTCMGHLMITNVDDVVGKEQLIAADIVCAYVAQLRGLRWLPHLFLYRKDEYLPIEIIQRLYSTRHFEKVKPLFDVTTVEELKQKLIDAEKHFGSNPPFAFGRMAPAVFKDINVAELCSSR